MLTGPDTRIGNHHQVTSRERISEVFQRLPAVPALNRDISLEIFLWTDGHIVVKRCRGLRQCLRKSCDRSTTPEISSPMVPGNWAWATVGARRLHFLFVQGQADRRRDLRHPGEQGHTLLDRAARHPSQRRLGRSDHRCDQRARVFALVFSSCALGATLEGINNQGEFARTARRSSAMASPFEDYAAQVHQLREEKAATLAPVTALSSQISQTIVDEMTEWRAVFSDRAQ